MSSDPTQLNVGDVIFAHARRDFIGRAIQFGEWLRWRGGHKWNHAAIIVGVEPGRVRIVQAESRGVTSKWFSSPSDIAPNGNVVVVKPPSSLTSVLRAVDFADAQVSDSYGFVTIFSIAVSIVVPWFLTIRKPGTWICSALVGESLRAGGWLHDWPDVYMVSPAQLYEALAE